MSLILELRDRKSHAGTPLIHPTSEHVVLAEVFGIVKNLPFGAALNPWLQSASCNEIPPSDDWTFSFWEKQPRPVGVHEGSTEVDLVMSSPQYLVFTEVKMDAAPSSGTTNDPERNQLIRNLDIGHRRASKESKRFSVVYITPDMQEPAIVSRIRSSPHPFPTDRLFWSSWGMIGDALAVSVQTGLLGATERKFALVLLSYLAKKRLWQNTLADDKDFYHDDKLLIPLRTTNSPFVPHANKGVGRDETWRSIGWDEEGLRQFLRGLRWEDKALLKLLAEAGGAMRQDCIMSNIPALRGKSASLRALKKHVNAACKGQGKAPILSVGTGKGNKRVHEINPQLGPLRQVVIEEARAFSIPEGLL